MFYGFLLRNSFVNILTIYVKGKDYRASPTLILTYFDRVTAHDGGLNIYIIYAKALR